MKIVYIAGAYRSTTINGVFENIMTARKAAYDLWHSTGYAVICPHLNSFLMDGKDTDQIFLDGDLELLRRCDAIYMLKGWEQSSGATIEHELAKELNLEIIYQGAE